MSALNRIVLIGEIDSSTEVGTNTQGDLVSKFTLAVSRPNFGQQTQVAVDKIKIVAYRHLAETSEKLGQGAVALIEGQIHTRSYEEKDGSKKYVTEVEARSIQPLSGNAEAQRALMQSGIQPLTAVKAEKQVLETIPKPNKSFNFEEKNTVLNAVPMQMPPEFEQELEEDIPF